MLPPIFSGLTGYFALCHLAIARLSLDAPTRARLAELEQRVVRVEEIEERLDFVERALGRSREAAPLRNPSEK